MDTAALAATVFPAVISVLIALAIGAVGYAIAAFNEGRRWQRQQRIACYTGVAKIHRKFVLLAEDDIGLKNRISTIEEFLDGRSAIEPPGATHENANRLIDLHNENKSALVALSQDINVAYAESELLSSDRLGRKLGTFVERLNEWYEALPDGHNLAHLRLLQDKAWLEFLDQAQRDLGLRNWWNRRP
jgi:hypothetical protein